MIKACIFDLDGTIANSFESMAYVANQILEEYGLPPQPAEKYKYYCGEGADKLMERCLRDAGDTELKYWKEAIEKYRKVFEENPLYKVVNYPGMPETLSVLKKQGLKLAVCTNKPHMAAVKVIDTMFRDVFDVVLGQNKDIKRKPAPDGPLKIAEMLHVRPGECLYIGDTGTDMKTGKSAGMYTVGVLWGFRTKEELEENGADLLVESPEDLLELCEDTEEM